ncbi:amino acid transporter [Candidatus Peregrinibacteria bacterium CG11_big_fil_rev_8_21_14_0_20_46_8]|nr:MAG: amino acid transporter [Candidatus Peregrinibacteria bacterium CG11_big_fil_rev_8_21_14_0_20_46_8]
MTAFLTFATIHILGMMSPGPDMAIVTRNALKYNRRIALFTTLGIVLGLMVHVSYSLLGLSVIIKQSILLFNLVKYLGAAYLIYIGLKSLRAKPQPLHEIQAQVGKAARAQTITSGAALRMGFLCNVLNPKATLFLFSLFTQVMAPNTPLLIQSLYGFFILGTALMWFGALALLFSHADIKQRFAKIQHHIERAFGAILIALGLKVALKE